MPVDHAAAVVDVCNTLTLDTLRAAYERIAYAKRLKKRPAARVEGVPITTVTLGVILALHTAIPLEEAAAELDRLNVRTPGPQWPDMIAVESVGVLNYAAQFPSQPINGDYLPPAEGAVTSYTVPMYVVLVVRPTVTYTFNKLLAFLIVHLGIFSPGAKLPSWYDILRRSTGGRRVDDHHRSRGSSIRRSIQQRAGHPPRIVSAMSTPILVRDQQELKRCDR